MLISTAVFAAELALIALSFNLIYRVAGFANFAHGEFVAVGAFVGVTCAQVMPLWTAAVCAAAATGLIAVGVNLSIFQHFPRAGIGTLMIVSSGLAIALRAAVQWVFGADVQRYDEPTRQVTLLGAHVSVMHLVIIATAILAVVAFAVTLRFTRAGRNMRAIADDIALAEVRGVRSALVVNNVWFISGALAGLAGVLMGIDTYVNPEMGIAILIPMFAAAIVGGVGSPFGAILGAVLVSVAQTAVVTIDFGALFGGASMHLGSEYKTVVAFALLIVVLAIRPNGFFGAPEARA